MSRDDQIKFEGVELSTDDRTLTDTKATRLVLALERQPKPPCVDRGDGKPCEFFRRCGSELLACRAFYAYTREPTESKEYRQWRTMPRQPNEHIYRKTYKAEVINKR